MFSSVFHFSVTNVVLLTTEKATSEVIIVKVN